MAAILALALGLLLTWRDMSKKAGHGQRVWLTAALALFTALAVYVACDRMLTVWMTGAIAIHDDAVIAAMAASAGAVGLGELAAVLMSRWATA